MKNKLIIITGPTAVGKSETAVRLAKDLDGEIVCADSVQIYKKMNIGSAKITVQEMDGIKHHMIDVVDFDEPFSVARYKEMAKPIVDDIIARGKVPIMVGGTGFYIASVLYDVGFEDEEVDEEYIKYLDEYELKNGKEALAELLKEIDEVSYQTIHYNNSKRIKRALSYYHIHKEPISVHNEREKNRPSPYDFLYCVLTRDRENLYKNINKRVDIMMEMGLLDEVKKLKDEGLIEGMTASVAIGYKELLEYLDGKMTLEEATDMIKQNSRRYAKRQMTWFRREKNSFFIDVEGINIEKILELIKSKL